MSGINVKRWLAGGLAAGLFVWIFEGVAAFLYMDEMLVAMDAHNLSMDMGPAMWVMTVAISCLAGLVAIFFYAAARPRFGPGPKTAVIVAIAVWCSGYLMALIGHHMLGLYPPKLLVVWGIIGLVEIILATILGAWIYQED